MRQWVWGVLLLSGVSLAACGSAPPSAGPAGVAATATATRPVATAPPPSVPTATLPPASATPRPPTATAASTPPPAPPAATTVPTAAPPATSNAPAGKTVAAQVGREVALRLGDTATIEGEGMTVEFARVVEDSRCPVGVQCVRAGRVVVALRVGRAGQAGEEITVASDPKDASAKTVNGYTVALRGVQPPKTVSGPGPNEYQITVVVTK